MPYATALHTELSVGTDSFAIGFSCFLLGFYILSIVFAFCGYREFKGMMQDCGVVNSG